MGRAGLDGGSGGGSGAAPIRDRSSTRTGLSCRRVQSARGARRVNALLPARRRRRATGASAATSGSRRRAPTERASNRALPCSWRTPGRLKCISPLPAARRRMTRRSSATSPTRPNHQSNGPRSPRRGSLSTTSRCFFSSDPNSVFVESGAPLVCPSATATGAATEVAATAKADAFHVTTDVPVSAYDIFPFGGADLLPRRRALYPTSAWGTNYVVLATPKGTASCAANHVRARSSQPLTGRLLPLRRAWICRAGADIRPSRRIHRPRSCSMQASTRNGKCRRARTISPAACSSPTKR